MRTIESILQTLPRPYSPTRLPQPPYHGTSDVGVVLGVESMKRHTTDEGWQIQAALHSSGYKLAGYHLPVNNTEVPQIVEEVRPGVVVVQDKREWDVSPGDFREQNARFHEVQILQQYPEIFKATILKDAHQNPRYHAESAREIACHAWIVYYNPAVVCHLAPYVRPQHLIRTWHTLDKNLVPPFTEDRQDVFLSGAVSGAYPFRSILVNNLNKLYNTFYLKHPGYGVRGCYTTSYLKQLSQFKVSICTCSKYGYALRKMIESTACGCIVVTDLPKEEVLPEIDGNLVRISPDIPIPALNDLLKHLCTTYNPEIQKDFAEKAKQFYDYRAEGSRLVSAIERMRQNYNASPASPIS